MVNAITRFFTNVPADLHVSRLARNHHAGQRDSGTAEQRDSGTARQRENALPATVEIVRQIGATHDAV